MPTGWRPDDVKEKYPVEIIEDPYSQVKYKTEASLGLKVWSFVQLILTLLLGLLMFNQIADHNFAYILIGGLFIMTSVFAYTSLMDRHQFALIPELIKVGIGILLFILIGGWFGMESSFGSALFIIYLIVSLLFTAYYLFIDKTGIVKDSFLQLSR